MSVSKLLTDYRDKCAEEETSRQDKNKDDITTVVSENGNSKMSCETTMPNHCNADELESVLENITGFSRNIALQ